MDTIPVIEYRIHTFNVYNSFKKHPDTQADIARKNDPKKFDPKTANQS